MLKESSNWIYRFKVFEITLGNEKFYSSYLDLDLDSLFAVWFIIANVHFFSFSSSHNILEMDVFQLIRANSAEKNWLSRQQAHETSSECEKKSFDFLVLPHLMQFLFIARIWSHLNFSPPMSQLVAKTRHETVWCVIVSGNGNNDASGNIIMWYTWIFA